VRTERRSERACCTELERVKHIGRDGEHERGRRRNKLLGFLQAPLNKRHRAVKLKPLLLILQGGVGGGGGPPDALAAASSFKSAGGR
jgi:hypothetical protein